MPFGIGALLKMVSPCGFRLLTGCRLPRDQRTARPLDKFRLLSYFEQNGTNIVSTAELQSAIAPNI